MAPNEKFKHIKETLLEQGVVAVVRVVEKRTEVALECSGSGCISRFVDGYGLFSRGILGINNYQVAPSFEITAENLDPVVDMTRFVSFSSLVSTRGIRVSGEHKPQKLKKVTEKEFDIVTEKILERINLFSHHLVRFFNGEVSG